MGIAKEAFTIHDLKFCLVSPERLLTLKTLLCLLSQKRDDVHIHVNVVICGSLLCIFLIYKFSIDIFLHLDNGVNVGAIVGGVIASVLVVLIIVLLVIFGRKLYPTLRGSPSKCMLIIILLIK